MAYSLMAVFKDCMASRDTAQSGTNEDTANVDLSPLRVNEI